MEHDQEEEDSVYDFLYVDAKRLALFLSQFNQFGHLTSLTRAATETGTKSGGLNVQILKVDTGSTAQTSQTRQFDTQWIAPLSFLDEVSKRGMLTRNLESARIGGLSLVTGKLSVFDLKVMQTAWSLDHVRQLILAGDGVDEQAYVSRQEKRKNARNNNSQLSSPKEAAIELIKNQPHAIVSTLRINSHTVWTSIQSEGLTISASDLMIKHGIRIAGEWSMVGIVDALPDNCDGDPFSLDEQAALSLGSLGGVIMGIAPALREVLGRPKSAYGMTPLMIFREISG